jgi:hypothetical protein
MRVAQDDFVSKQFTLKFINLSAQSERKAGFDNGLLEGGGKPYRAIMYFADNETETEVRFNRGLSR